MNKLVAFASVALLLASATSSWAAAGDLDATFDGDGRVVTDFGMNDGAGRVIVLPDGKLLVSNSPNGPSSLLRYLPNGALDTSFDGDGVVQTTYPGAGDSSLGLIARQPDGKIVACGHVFFSGGDSDVACARYQADGAVDTTFGTNGFVTTDLSGTDYPQSVLLQPDGKIVVTGECGPDQQLIGMVRYDSSGALDPSFDGDGVLLSDLGPGTHAWRAALQADGKIVVVGINGVNGAEAGQVLVARYAANGALDPSFDGDGVVLTTVPPAGYSFAEDVVVQGDGKIVVAGTNEDPTTSRDFLLVRYLSNGALDTSFGGDGVVTTDFAIGPDQNVKSLVVEPTGKLVASGDGYLYSDPPGDATWYLARYNSNGSLDSTFGSGGRVMTSFVHNVFASQLVAQPDGKLVLVGATNTHGFQTADIVIDRYLSAVCGNKLVEYAEQCDHGTKNGTDGCCSSTCTLLGADGDGDGYCDSVGTASGKDNCPGTYNPDQANLDADNPAVGDLCDACPGCSAASCCQAARTAAGIVDTTGTTLQTPDGAITLDVPDGTFNSETSLSITGVDQSSYGIGGSTSNYAIVSRFGPGGPLGRKVTITYQWPDTNGDGKVDVLNIDETNLKLYHNGKRLGACRDDKLIACECLPQAPPCAASPDCAGLADTHCDNTDCSTSATLGNPNCDRANNRWPFQVDDFSEYALGDEPCGRMSAAKLTLQKLAAPSGDDGAGFKGTFTLPPGLTFADVRPDLYGLRLSLTDDATAVMSALLPAGAYDGISGWKINGSASKATYVSHAAAPPGGIVKAALKDESNKAAGQVAVSFKGKNGAFAASPKVAVGITFPEASACSLITFPGPDPKHQSCRVKSGGRGLGCEWRDAGAPVLCCNGLVDGLPVCFDSDAALAPARCAAENGTLAAEGLFCDGAGSGRCLGAKSSFGCCETPSGTCFENGSYLMPVVCADEGGTTATNATCNPTTHTCASP